MNNYNLGYACINKNFSERSKKQRITTNRGMIRRTFLEKGLPYVSELALANCQDLLKILQWNAKQDIHFFRMSSGLFPWGSEYAFEDLPDYEAIAEILFQ